MKIEHFGSLAISSIVRSTEGEAICTFHSDYPDWETWGLIFLQHVAGSFSEIDEVTVVNDDVVMYLRTDSYEDDKDLIDRFVNAAAAQAAVLNELQVLQQVPRMLPGLGLIGLDPQMEPHTDEGVTCYRFKTGCKWDPFGKGLLGQVLEATSQEIGGILDADTGNSEVYGGYMLLYMDTANFKGNDFDAMNLFLEVLRVTVHSLDDAQITRLSSPDVVSRRIHVPRRKILN